MVNILDVVRTSSLVVLAISGATIAYNHHRQQAEKPQQAIKRKRLQVYHDLMRNVIKLNRTAVDLDDDGTLHDSHDRLVLNQESELGDHIDDITETYYRSYYIIDGSVRDAVSEYVDYVSSYHEQGIQVGQILSKSSNIIQAMREDLGLSDIFNEVDEL